jgi:hypothetical protein
LQEVGTALTGEEDLEILLSRILKEGRALLQAEAGSVFLREDEMTKVPDATGKDDLHKIQPYLVLKVAQNEAIRFPFQEMRLPLDAKTVSGYVGTSGKVVNVPDVYALDETSSFRRRLTISVDTSVSRCWWFRCRNRMVRSSGSSS